MKYDLCFASARRSETTFFVVLFCFFVLFVCLLQQVSLASQGEKSVSISWEFELTDFEISDEMRW